MSYKSTSSGESCTAAQLIAEIFITRQEASKGNVVPYKFWNLPKYKLRYIRQIRDANSLLKIYTGESIIAALMSKDGNWIFSSNAKILTILIEKEEVRIEKLNSDLDSVTETVHKDPKPMKTFGKRSVLDILRESDG